MRLTAFEARVLLKILEAAQMDRTIPLADLSWTPQETAAVHRIRKKAFQQSPKQEVKS